MFAAPQRIRDSCASSCSRGVRIFKVDQSSARRRKSQSSVGRDGGLFKVARLGCGGLKLQLSSRTWLACGKCGSINSIKSLIIFTCLICAVPESNQVKKWKLAKQPSTAILCVSVTWELYRNTWNLPALLLVLCVCVTVWHINYHKVAKINHKLNMIKFIYRQDNERAHMRLSRAAGLGCFLPKGA